MSDIYQFNVGGTTYNLANLGLLAPVQITLTADRLYNTGDQFIYTGLLYEATETIAQGTSITIGSNAQLADCVTKQISEINSNLSEIQSNVINPSGSVTMQNYTSSNPYTFPKDGYIRIAAKGANSYLSLGLKDANDNYICQQSAFGNSTVNEYVNSTVYVKKGMKGYIEYYNNQIACSYFPFI